MKNGRLKLVMDLGGVAETVFSSLKRMFREHASAKKFPNMVK
ncbi:MAG: hypothetical protein WAM14_25275 [Candidatus Nitrosopolaris sp.]